MTQTLTTALCNVYRRAQYRVTLTHQIIHFSAMGQSDALKALQINYKVGSAALITAYNPYSQLTDNTVNHDNQKKLIAEVSKSWRYLPGTGVDPKSQWQSEPSLLVLGIGLAEALTLGRAYRQHALIFVDADGYTSLKTCDPANQSIVLTLRVDTLRVGPR